MSISYKTTKSQNCGADILSAQYKAAKSRHRPNHPSNSYQKNMKKIQKKGTFDEMRKTYLQNKPSEDGRKEGSVFTIQPSNTPQSHMLSS